ncbi:MAG: hypothetical protein GF411_04240 [Candidatus Lokiarchaeota archaeon]|nr:hypothetical protein [Candidatus Lokiarchaeota archaeon]
MERHSFIWYLMLIVLLLFIPLSFEYTSSSGYVNWHIDATVWTLQNNEPLFLINPLFPLAILGSIPALLFNDILHARRVNQNITEEAVQATIFSLLIMIPVSGFGNRLGHNRIIFIFSIARFLNLLVIFFIILPFAMRKIVDVVLVTSRKLLQEQAVEVIEQEEKLRPTFRILQTLITVLFFCPVAVSILNEEGLYNYSFSSLTFAMYFEDSTKLLSNYQKITLGIFPLPEQILILLLSVIPIFFVYYTINNMRKKKLRHKTIFLLSILSFISIWFLNWTRFNLPVSAENLPVVYPIPLVIVLSLIATYLYRHDKTKLSSIHIDPEKIRKLVVSTREPRYSDEAKIKIPFLYRWYWRIRRGDTKPREPEESPDT